MNISQAERLADLLMGMEDAKRELIDGYVIHMEADTDQGRRMQEAGERWMKAFNDLSDFLDDFE